MSIITLTTDFGGGDWFVGSMKGVILGLNPQVTIVDITHGVPAGDIRAGAFALLASYRHFPQNTVHVAIVDPGVGSSRAAIVVRTEDYFFVGPDNGVLSFALGREKIQEVRRLENEKFFRAPVSKTFHGRDVFAPVAAHLSCGIPCSELGGTVADVVRLPWPKQTGNHGEVVYIDRFGNVITNIERPAVKVVVAGREISVVDFYQQVPAGQPLALIGSTGFLEIAVNGDGAASALNLNVGDPVEVC
jgi:S-adenosylmethionine hydrolase